MDIERIPTSPSPIKKIRTGAEKIQSEAVLEETKVKPIDMETRKLTLQELKERKEKLSQIRQEIKDEQTVPGKKTAPNIAVGATEVPETEEIDEYELPPISPEGKEQREQLVLARLADVLKQMSGEKISVSAKENLDIIDDKTINLPTKIRKMLNLYQADKLPNISDREKVYTHIINMLKSAINAETEKAFSEGREELFTVKSEEEFTEKSKQRQAGLEKKLGAIHQKYDTHEIFDYLNLSIEKGGSFEES